MARRSRRRVPKAIRDDEYRLLLEHAPDELYRDLFVIMRWAGLRVAEAVGLRWESVDLAQLQMTVTGKGDVERAVDILPEAERMLRRRAKISLSVTGRPPQVAAGENPLHGATDISQGREITPEWGLKNGASVHAHSWERTSYVFPKPDGRPLTTRAVQRVMQRIRDRLGLPQDRMTPHKLRHAYATDLVNRGVPIHVVSAQLGHADVSTTSQYLWAQPGQARQFFES